MVRIAEERISDLFALADSEAKKGSPSLPDRYVRLARRIGMRYNVRLISEYRQLYCRRCSTYWVEGRTVRTRLRRGREVRTCLACGGIRRVRLHPVVDRPTAPEGTNREAGEVGAVALVSDPTADELGDDGGDELP